jgi:hypothetical protein
MFSTSPPAPVQHVATGTISASPAAPALRRHRPLLYAAEQWPLAPTPCPAAAGFPFSTHAAASFRCFPCSARRGDWRLPLQAPPDGVALRALPNVDVGGGRRRWRWSRLARLWAVCSDSPCQEVVGDETMPSWAPASDKGMWRWRGEVAGHDDKTTRPSPPTSAARAAAAREGRRCGRVAAARGGRGRLSGLRRPTPARRRRASDSLSGQREKGTEEKEIK